MKRYEQFINESVRDKMIPKSEENIKEELNKLSQNHKNMRLRNAVDDGDTESARLLLEVGADVHYQEEYSLRFASRHGLTSLVKLLLDYGADVNKFNGSALINASYTGAYDTVKLLLDYGADASLDNKGALRMAKQKGYKDVVNLLKQYKKTNESVRDFMKPKSKEKILKHMKKLSKDRKTKLLYDSVMKKDLETARFLLDNGADIEVVDCIPYAHSHMMKYHKEIRELVDEYRNKKPINKLKKFLHFNEKVEYKFKDDYHKQRYQEDLDLINNAKVGDVLPHGVIYQYVEYLTLTAGQAKYEDCFVDGDLSERLEHWDNYTLEELPMDKVGTWEWNTDQSDVDAYKMKYLENKEYPPIVVDKFSSSENYYCIIDGTHRAKALKKAGETTILAFVGK